MYSNKTRHTKHNHHISCPLYLALSLILVSLTTQAPTLKNLSEFANLQHFANINLPKKARNMINGYLSDTKDDHHLIQYTFMPAQHSPLTKPILFWANGGPGVAT